MQFRTTSVPMGAAAAATADGVVVVSVDVAARRVCMRAPGLPFTNPALPRRPLD